MVGKDRARITKGESVTIKSPDGTERIITPEEILGETENPSVRNNTGPIERVLRRLLGCDYIGHPFSCSHTIPYIEFYLLGLLQQVLRWITG